MQNSVIFVDKCLKINVLEIKNIRKLGNIVIIQMDIVVHSLLFLFHKTSWKGESYLFNSSLPLPPASQIPRHKPGDYC